MNGERREFSRQEVQHFIKVCGGSGLVHYSAIKQDRGMNVCIVEKYREPVYREYHRSLAIRRSIE